MSADALPAVGAEPSRVAVLEAETRALRLQLAALTSECEQQRETIASLEPPPLQPCTSIFFEETPGVPSAPTPISYAPGTFPHSVQVHKSHWCWVGRRARELVQGGKLVGGTKVFAEGMANWRYVPLCSS